jgi:Ca-activated chloride channel family protein
MTFAHPWLLLLLVVPLFTAIWIWRRRSGALVLPFDHSGARPKRFLRVLVDAAETLPALGLAVTVVLLANPQRLAEPKTRRVLTNIEFCVDISGSMTSPFGEGSRYDAAMHAIEEFLDYRQGDAFGLTFFGNNVLHWVPLTSDTSAIRCAPPFMRPENAPPWFGGTMIGKALYACRDVLTEREEGDRMIILVSDGQSADLDGGAADEVAQKLRADNIAVYHIHAAEGQVPDEVVDIAAITGGEAFAAGDPGALKTVFQRIDQMRETRLEKIAAETLDDYVPWCWAGLAVLAAWLLCAFGLRYTPW